MQLRQPRIKEQKADLISKAEAGETFTSRFGGEDFTYTVLPACANTTNGRWFCVTHKTPFDNQLQKDIHIGDGKAHRLTWTCFEHGPEQP
jgi:hypothetical protein